MKLLSSPEQAPFCLPNQKTLELATVGDNQQLGRPLSAGGVLQEHQTGCCITKISREAHSLERFGQQERHQTSVVERRKQSYKVTKIYRVVQVITH